MFEFIAVLMLLVALVIGVYLMYGKNKILGSIIIVTAIILGVLLAYNHESDTVTNGIRGGEPMVIPMYHLATEANPYTPQQVGSVYLHPDFKATPSSTKASYSGAGKKIGIITCYNHKYLQRDFDVFCAKYDLPQATLKIHNRAEKFDYGWAMETCLDTQWAHVFAPDAEIHVFQAKTSTYSSIKSALEDAVSEGMDIVSMSLGSGESQYADSQIQAIFENNPNIIFVAASGDWSEVSYPSSSNKVISVGGTRLLIGADGNNNTSTPVESDYSLDPSRFSKIGETDWSTSSGIGSGHGISELYTRPSYQDGHNAAERRSTPDLSLIASSPSQNGVSIYCNPYNGDARNPRVSQNWRYWKGVEGTSVSSPIFAGMLATINATRGTGREFTREQIMQYLYSRIPTNLPVETSSDGVGYVGRNFIQLCVSE